MSVSAIPLPADGQADPTQLDDEPVHIGTDVDAGADAEAEGEFEDEEDFEALDRADAEFYDGYADGRFICERFGADFAQKRVNRILLNMGIDLWLKSKEDEDRFLLNLYCAIHGRYTAPIEEAKLFWSLLCDNEHPSDDYLRGVLQSFTEGGI